MFIFRHKTARRTGVYIIYNPPNSKIRPQSPKIYIAEALVIALSPRLTALITPAHTPIVLLPVQRMDRRERFTPFFAPTGPADGPEGAPGRTVPDCTDHTAQAKLHEPESIDRNSEGEAGSDAEA